MQRHIHITPCNLVTTYIHPYVVQRRTELTREYKYYGNSYIQALPHTVIHV